MTCCAIPMSAPDLTPADLDAVNAVLRAPHLSIGPQTESPFRIQAFDRATAEYVGVAHAAGINDAGDVGRNPCSSDDQGHLGDGAG